MRKKGGLEAKSPRKFFKTTSFTLAINVIDALFCTTVELEKRQKFGKYRDISKEFT